MLAGLMTKLKRPRQASSSSSVARKKESPKKGAIPAKKGRAAATLASKGSKPAVKASKPAAKASKPAAKASKSAATRGKPVAKSGKPAAKGTAKAPKSEARTAIAKQSKVAARASKASARTSKVAAKPSKAGGSQAPAGATKATKPVASAAPKTAAKVARKAAAAPKPAKPAAAAKTSSQLALPLTPAHASDGGGATTVVEGGDDAAESGEGASDDSGEPAPESPRKVQLKALLHETLEQQLAAARAAHHAAVEGATHEEARPENDKDTRGLEQSYLARGHAQRVADLEAGLVSLAEMSVLALGDGAPIALGAIVTIDDGDHPRCFLLAPAGGGMVLPGDITVLTPTSPIGRALLGRGVDDECEVGSGAHARTLTIVAVE